MRKIPPPPNQEIHFCKIDVEGYERQVLEGIKNWRKFRPWIFAMEATLPGTDIPCHDKWEDLLLKNDYLFAFQFSINRYYVDSEKEHLLVNFAKVTQFVAQNDIVQMVMQPVRLN
ncbi:MAG: FkbM family methyltransferase [Selenomonadaceae bacterium]|nr:FkbM family methyltransferase [Selenomonadaceae bacterium]